MRDYYSILSIIRNNNEIIGCNIIHPITLEIKQVYLEESKQYLKEIPKKHVEYYGILDYNTGNIIKESYTIINKAYGYLTICNANGTILLVLKEQELIKNANNILGNMGAKFTNISISPRVDNKINYINVIGNTILDVSVLLYSGVFDNDLDIIKVFINNIIGLRIATIQNKNIQTIGLKPYTINNLVANRISLIEALETFSNLRKDILNNLYMSQRTRVYILETLDIRGVIEQCKIAFK